MGANILGGMYANLGQMDAAVVQWERARENPDLVDARLNLIEFYARSGDTHEVSQLVDEVLRVNPELTWTRIRGSVAATVRSSAEQKRIFLAAGIPE